MFLRKLGIEGSFFNSIKTFYHQLQSLNLIEKFNCDLLKVKNKI